ncbi:unnamed protein product [Tuber aestivum]|uniref:Uncharacterized protein n=1 Tax=Tuber aestivum TaxID=59557 RepID=A0A292PVN0_9PEZI|nr:unnamed protein product [Tuber aestivum]
MPLPSGPTDGTNREGYCRFSQRYERPGYLQRLMDESSKGKKTMKISSTRMSPSVVVSTAALT